MRVTAGVFTCQRHRVSQRGKPSRFLLRRLVLGEGPGSHPLTLSPIIRVTPRAVQVDARGVRPVVSERASVRVQHRYDDERDALAKLHGHSGVAGYEIDETAEGVRARRLTRVNPARDHHDGAARGWALGGFL